MSWPFYGEASKTNVHGPASYMMNTGFVLPGFPCLGAWLSYGLGSLNDNLPTFVVLPDPRGLPYNNRGNFSSGFLPVIHQGTILKPNAANPIADLFPPKSAKFITPQSETEGLALLQQMNREHAEPLAGRFAAGCAHRLVRIGRTHADQRPGSAGHRQGDGGDAQAVRPGRQDHGDVRPQLSDRPAADRARRAFRAGVERSGRADEQLGQSQQTSTRSCRRLPPASISRSPALLHDLKARGLFEDTLLVWSTEFGRQPFSQGAVGRDHNGGTFVSLAGRRRRQGRRRLRRKRRMVVARPSSRPTATICTPPFCICSASTTPN